MVFSGDEIKPVEVLQGMLLRELVGRAATAKSEWNSVARFTLEKGHETQTSHNKVSEETFLVIRGHGQVVLGERAEAVGPGSVVAIPPGVSHSARAGADESLEFYAVEAPAYDPADFVVEPAPVSLSCNLFDFTASLFATK